MFYFIDNDKISVVFENGTTAVWSSNSKDYKRVKELAINNNWIQIEMFYNFSKILIDCKVDIDKNDNFIVHKEGKKIEIKSDELNNKLTEFIQLLKKKGIVKKNIEYIKPFLIKMFNNPYIDAVTELYDFCTAMDFEICEDGDFLAYKAVQKDLSSFYDNGATKHKLNEYVEVDKFDCDRTVTCSKGLHFCSSKYLEYYKNDNSVILVLKIDPRDVVAIPIDYNFQKGRCKRYLPVSIIKHGEKIDKKILNSISKDVKVDKQSTKSIRKVSRTDKEVFKLFKEGKSFKEIANIFKIKIESAKRSYRRAKQYFSRKQ